VAETPSVEFPGYQSVSCRFPVPSFFLIGGCLARFEVCDEGTHP